MKSFAFNTLCGLNTHNRLCCGVDDDTNKRMTRIFITGDTHGLQDIIKIDRFNTLMGKELSKADYLIITGDAGMCWIGDPERDPSVRKMFEDMARSRLEDYRKTRPSAELSMIEASLKADVEKALRHDQDYWDKMPWTTLFIDGNHENHAALDSYPVEEWHGGKIHRITDSIIHLMRGQIFNIEGTTFFTFGGAESTDKEYRTENLSWWARELPSAAEYEEALLNLDKCGGKVDYILTHCAPESYLNRSGMPGMYYRSSNELTDFFDAVMRSSKVDFKGWYFGHYHSDQNFDKFHLLYDSVMELELYRKHDRGFENGTCSSEIRKIWEAKRTEELKGYPKRIDLPDGDSVMSVRYIRKSVEELLFRAPGDGIVYFNGTISVRVDNATEEELLKKMMPLFENGRWYPLLDSCPGDDYSPLQTAVNAVLGRTAGFGYKDGHYCVFATEDEGRALLTDTKIKEIYGKIYESRNGQAL